MLLSHLFESKIDDELAALFNYIDTPSNLPKPPPKIKYRPLSPGSRRELNFRISDLKDRKEQIESYYNQITSLMGAGGIPPELEADLRQLETEYKQAIAVEAEKLRNLMSNSKIHIFLKGLSKKCSVAIAAIKEANTFFYRGSTPGGEVLIGKPFTDRRTLSSNASVQKEYDEAISKLGFTALRRNSTFTSGKISLAKKFGSGKSSGQYMIFPINGFAFTWSETEKDIVLNLWKRNDWLDIDKINQLYDLIFSIEDNKKYFLTMVGANPNYSPEKQNIGTSNGLLGSKAESHLWAVKDMKQEGMLPEDTPDEISYYIDPKKVVESMALRKDNLVEALESGHEITVSGPYYAVEIKHESLVREFFGMPANSNPSMDASSRA